MESSGSRTRITVLVAGLLGLIVAFPVVTADEKAAPEPVVTLVLGPGQASASPARQGSSRSGGGNIHVTQPASDTVSVTMTGAVAAKPHPVCDSTAVLAFDLAQGFEVVFHTPRVKGAKLVLWSRVVGALRSDCCCHKGGSAEVSTPGRAAILCGPVEVLALELPPRAVTCGQNLSVHDREGPVWVPVTPGKYTLRQVFGISAAHRKGLFGRPASAEFAPDPALETDWIGKREPFRGAAKKDFGFQVILKVIADEEPAGNGAKP